MIILVPAFGLFLQLLAGAMHAPGAAQTLRGVTGAGDTEPAAAAPAPQAIPPAAISIKAEETAAILRAMRDRHRVDSEIASIRDRLPAALGDYEELLETTEQHALSFMSVREHGQLERRWRQSERTVGEWRRNLQRRTHSLDRDLQTLHALRVAWDLTLADAGQAGLSGALLDVANTARDSVREVEDRFGLVRVELLAIEEQIDRATELAGEGLDVLGGVSRNARERFFSRDAPSLWALLAEPPPRARHEEQLRLIWDESRHEQREFFAASAGRLVFLVVLAGALTAGLVLLSRRACALLQAAPAAATSSRVLSRPLSMASIVTFVAFLFMFPAAPRIIIDVATLLLFFPLFRVLPAQRFVARRFLFGSLVAVNVLGRLAEVLLHRSPLQRLVLLLMAIVALGVLLRVLRARRAGQPPARHDLGRRAVRAVGWIAAAHAAAAILLNILGYVTLTSMLMRAVSISAYLAVSALALYFVLQAVIEALLRTDTARRLASVRSHAGALAARSRGLLRLRLVGVWAEETLHLLLLRRPSAALLRRVLTAQAKFGELGISLGDFLAFGITIWAAFALSRFIRFALAEDVFPRVQLPRGVPNAISMAVHYTLLLAGFFLAVAATGMDLGRFAILAGAFGLGVGFGLQNIINNFVSGLILIVERPIMPGDTVQIGDLAGEVKRIGMRSSTVRTWEGAEVIVPNGNLIASQVINWTLSDPLRRLDIKVGVAYGTDPRRVQAVLVGVARQLPDIAAEPEPAALFMGFGESALDFELRVWTSRIKNFMGLKSDVTLAVHAALEAAGIQIPFPQRDLHLKSVASDAQQALRDAPAGRTPPATPRR